MKFVLFALSLLTLSTANSPVRVDGYKIGDIATDFSLPNVDGDMVSLGDFKDVKGFIVIFTCNTCPIQWPMKIELSLWTRNTNLEVTL